jgi:tryptophan-rich sensory protein
LPQVFYKNLEMSSVDLTTFAALTGLVVACSNMSKLTSREMWEVFKVSRASSYFRPMIFQVVWTILYACIIVSGYFFLNSSNPFNTWTVPTFAMYLSNIILNGYWVKVFFDNEQRGWQSIVVIVLLLITGIVYAVFTALNGWWISFGLWVPYLLWLVVALGLNVSFTYAMSDPNVVNNKVEIGGRIKAKAPVLLTPPKRY